MEKSIYESVDTKQNRRARIVRILIVSIGIIVFGTACVFIGMTIQKNISSNSDPIDMSTQEEMDQSGRIISEKQEEKDDSDEVVTDQIMGDSALFETERGVDSQASSEEEKLIPNIDVEAEVANIRKLYYGTQDSVETMRQSSLSSDVIAYDDDGEIKKIVCNRGWGDIDYSREYYFSSGKLYFAFVYKGTEEHRLYFYNEILIRYIDENSITYDLGDVEEYQDYATGWQSEAYSLMN